MKKILFIISSLVPIVIFILRYINDKNSVIKWNIICIEYVCLLIIVYIRTIFIQKKYNKLIALYKQQKYELIINSYKVNYLMHTSIIDSSNLIISVCYWNLNRDDIFLSIINQIKNKDLLSLKQFYLYIYYLCKRQIDEAKTIFSTFESSLNSKDKNFVLFKKLINTINNHQFEDVERLLGDSFLIGCDVRTKYILSNLSSFYNS